MLSNTLIVFISLAAQCGIVGADGQPADVWENSAVIYANVLSVEKRGYDTYLIRLNPLATLTGTFDSAFQGEISIGPAIGNRENTEIDRVPRVGAKVIVLIDRRSVSSVYLVRTGSASFFPVNERRNAPCLFEVTGFDDPKVTETIENLRKLRGKQREEAEKAKAEQKAAAEKNGK
jgi:hypothetical protein